MAILRVSLFGGMKIVRSPDDAPVKLTKMSQLMLAYLLLGRTRLHPREMVSELFWGDLGEERARRCLNTALWRLRAAIDGEAPAQSALLIITNAGEIGINPGGEFWLDVAEFEECVNSIKSKSYDTVARQEIDDLEAKAQLYIGELLEGIYTDWAIRAREYERMLYIDSLRYLMGYYGHQQMPLRALAFGQKILDIDPLREDIHREMMRLFLASGQRALAIRQYALCRQNLRDELGIEPLNETQLLYQHILTLGEQPPQPVKDRETVEYEELLARLWQAVRNMEYAQDLFQKALRQLQTILPDHNIPGGLQNTPTEEKS